MAKRDVVVADLPGVERLATLILLYVFFDILKWVRSPRSSGQGKEGRHIPKCRYRDKSEKKRIQLYCKINQPITARWQSTCLVNALDRKRRVLLMPIESEYIQNVLFRSQIKLNIIVHLPPTDDLKTVTKPLKFHEK